MKICYTCLSSPWDVMTGGGQIVTHKIAAKMAELGHTVHVIYTRTEDILPIPAVNYSVTWAHHFKREYLNVFSVFFALIRLLRREKFDIIHSIEGEAVLLIPFLGRRTVFLTTTHCPLFPDIAAPFFFYHPVRFVKHVRRYIRYYLIKLSMRFSKYAIAVSDFSKNNVAHRLGISPDKIKVILNGVGVELLECGYDRRRHTQDTVIYFGRLDDQKGVDTLIEAVALIAKKRPVKTIIVGTGWKERELKSLAGSLGLQDSIDFTGMVSHDKISEYIIKADLCVFPSRSDNCPLTILEAMAIGIPVISTPVGGIPELIRNGYSGVLVKQEDPQKLSEAMIDLLDHAQNRELLSNNAKKYVSDNLTWDKVALKYSEFYESLLRS